MTRFIRISRTATMLAMASSLLLFTVACQSTPEPEPEPEPAPSEFSDSPPPAPAKPKSVDVDIATVYFDFDKSDIRQDAVRGLQAGAVVLKETGVKVVIAGHTDNRGSEEYNLALGERRAASVRRYLANLGVSTNQMTIVSYGEVRPAVQGNNESAWSKNRRAMFKAVD